MKALILALALAAEISVSAASSPNRVGPYPRQTNAPAGQSAPARRVPPGVDPLQVPAFAAQPGQFTPEEERFGAVASLLAGMTGAVGLAFFLVAAMLWVLVPFLIWAQLNRLTSIRSAIHRMEDTVRAQAVSRVRVPCPQCGAPVEAVRGITVACPCGQHVRVEAS